VTEIKEFGNDQIAEIYYSIFSLVSRTLPDIKKETKELFTKGWLAGFIEAEGSFIYVTKDTKTGLIINEVYNSA
jgi:hypothetical protein